MPASPSEEDQRAAEYLDALWNRAFADPQFLGRYPALPEPEIAPYAKPDELAIIHQPLDYFGLNHYSRNYVKHGPQTVLSGSMVPPPQSVPVTGMGWEINLQGIGLPASVAYGAYIGEVLAPILVLIGWYARVGAGLIVINMLFAILLAHRPELWTLTPQGGWALELQGFFLFVALALVFTGPGRFSLNNR